MSAVRTESVAFYEQYPWQVFATFRTIRPESLDEIQQRWKWFLRNSEERLRFCLGTLHAFESRTKSGEQTPYHVHAAIAGKKPIPVGVLVEQWNAESGRMNQLTDLALVEHYMDTATLNARAEQRAAELNEPVKYSQGGIHYLLKYSGDPHAHLDTHNLHRFMDGGSGKSNHRSLRAARRMAR